MLSNMEIAITNTCSNGYTLSHILTTVTSDYLLSDYIYKAEKLSVHLSAFFPHSLYFVVVTAVAS